MIIWQLYWKICRPQREKNLSQIIVWRIVCLKDVLFLLSKGIVLIFCLIKWRGKYFLSGKINHFLTKGRRVIFQVADDFLDGIAATTASSADSITVEMVKELSSNDLIGKSVALLNGEFPGCVHTYNEITDEFTVSYYRTGGKKELGRSSVMSIVMIFFKCWFIPLIVTVMTSKM